MQKGYIIGTISGLLLVIYCLWLMFHDVNLAGFGWGFLLAPIILLAVAISSFAFLHHRSVTVSNTAKVLIWFTVAAIGLLIIGLGIL